MPPCLFCRCELLLFSDSWRSAVRIPSEAEITAQQHPADCGASPCLAGADPPLKSSKRRVTFKGPKAGCEAGADDQVLLLSYYTPRQHMKYVYVCVFIFKKYMVLFQLFYCDKIPITQFIILILSVQLSGIKYIPTVQPFDHPSPELFSSSPTDAIHLLSRYSPVPSSHSLWQSPLYALYDNWIEIKIKKIK